jgi:hypothetical protein
VSRLVVLAASVVALAGALVLFSAVPIRARTPCDVHYRWQQKIDATHLNDTPISTTVATMLSWASPPFTAAAIYWCQPRNARERRVYRLTAWARRLKLENSASGDFDWHIELTGARTSSVYNCIVVEIPPDTINPAYFQARQDFLATVTDAGSTINGSGDVVPPVRVKVSGLAFFDGEHRGAGSNQPHKHGRCNSKTSALWEIHPVYSVSAP